MKIKIHNLKEISKIELFTIDGKMLFQNIAAYNNEMISIPMTLYCLPIRQ